MLNIIQEIRKALEKECYIVALTLSLTLPDICSQVENGRTKADRKLYINWFNSHVQDDAFYFPMAGFEYQTFNGNMCYSLRCKVFHNENTDVKNSDLDVEVDNFKLLKPSEEDYKPRYTYHCGIIKTTDKRQQLSRILSVIVVKNQFFFQ